MSIGNAAVFMKNITAIMMREYETPEIILVFMWFILSNKVLHRTNAFFSKLLRLRKIFSQAVLQVGCCAVALPRAKNRLWSFTSE